MEPPEKGYSSVNLQELKKIKIEINKTFFCGHTVGKNGKGNRAALLQELPCVRGRSGPPGGHGQSFSLH